ncbi:MFS transporter [Microlunatus sp. GCM10028923]|uniref:MFS transporter n=1 Tax=Microlunatus sp. GCM10028923 TaxID=3273400 RepID=UPI0036209CB8
MNDSSTTAAARPVVRTAADVARLVADRPRPTKGAAAVVILALGGIFMDAYDFSSIAFGITEIRRQFGLDALMTGVVNASIMVGSVVGASVGGVLVDRLGRYRLFMADMIFFVVAAIGCALAPNEWWLIFFRFVMGIGVGLDLPVAMAFLAEFSSLRGKGNRSQRVNAWSPAWYAATGFGYLVVLIAFLALPESGQPLLWRIVVGFGAVPALVVLLVRRRFLKESPQWLANQGDLRGAVDILRSAYGIDAELAADAVTTRRAPAANWTAFARLWSPTYRVRTIVALCVSVFSTFGYNAVAYGTPLIISTLFQQGPLITIASSLVINLLFGVGGGLVGVALVSKAGSRRLALIGFALQAVALLILAVVGIPTGPLIAIAVGMLALFIFAQAGGPGAQLMSYATLSYPTSLRGTGVGFNEAVKRVFSVISLFFFPILAGALQSGVFWIIAIFPLLGVLALLVFRWDPVGVDTDAEEYRTQN